MLKRFASVLLVVSSTFSSGVFAQIADTQAVNAFVTNMVTKHHFDRQALSALMQKVDVQDAIIQSMQRPAEAMPWYRYRKIFMQDARINGGVQFWQQHKTALEAVVRRYGVPAEVIIAIMGVETLYGKNTGSYRVIDALATLGFAYPKRSAFFLSELEHFLILCREEKINPLKPMGSYAGAMGMPQFMPSSYRSYAADFEADGRRDIWQNPADVFASIANYLAKHKWQAGAPIAFAVQATDLRYKTLLNSELKPDASVAKLRQYGVQLPSSLTDATLVKLLSFEQETGQDLWVGLDNFYCITRYNHSPLYAMAVFQLSQAIKQRYAASAHE